jgi:type II secretory pathway pseudopilin PulG
MNMKASEELRMKSEESVPSAVRRGAARSRFKLFTLNSSLLTSSSGFSLVEVMLAIGIVAFAVVGVLTAFPVGIEAARDSRDENTAALIADDVFTRIRSQAFGKTFTLPESTWTKRANGLRLSPTSPYGWTSLNNMLHYTRDGRLSNADSTPDGKAPIAAYKGDEGYFGVRIYIDNDPYNPLSGTRDDISVIQLTGLANVRVEVSWPARTPYNNRKFKRIFETNVCDLY